MSDENLPVVLVGKEPRKKVEKPYKQEQFVLYAFWRSMPFAFRLTDAKNLEKMGFDIHDEVFKKLLAIKTKTDFCANFDVNMKQLKRWDDSDILKNQIEIFNRESNVIQFKKDIDFAFTKKAIQEADPYRVELWYKIYMGWNDKLGIKHDVGDTLADIMRQQLSGDAKPIEEE